MAAACRDDNKNIEKCPLATSQKPKMSGDDDRSGNRNRKKVSSTQISLE